MTGHGFLRGVLLLCCLASTGASPSLQSAAPFFVKVTPDAGVRSPDATLSLIWRDASGAIRGESLVGGVVPQKAWWFVSDETRYRMRFHVINPSAGPAQVEFQAFDGAGVETGRLSRVVPGGAAVRIASTEWLRDGLAQTVRIASEVPVAAFAVAHDRSTGRAVSVVPAGAAAGALYLPHVARGGGYASAVVIANPSPVRSRGRVTFAPAGAEPERTFDLAPGGLLVLDLPIPSSLRSGAVTILTDAGSAPPVAWLQQVVQTGPDGPSITWAGAAPLRIHAQVPLDTSAETGLAIANTSSADAEVTVELVRNTSDRVASVLRRVPAGDRFVASTSDLFPELRPGLAGFVRVVTAVPMAVAAFRSRTGSSGVVTVASIPLAPFDTGGGPVFLPIPDDDPVDVWLGLSNDQGGERSGTVSFHAASGEEVLPTRRLVLPPLVSRSIRPGVALRVASLTVRDPLTNQPATEIAVNAGGQITPAVVALDDAGRVRDDLDVQLTLTNPEVAALDGIRVLGRQPGFSTLVVEAGGALTTVTVTVTDVRSVAAGFDVAGMAQDLGGRTYLASPADHTILVADYARGNPVIWTGARGVAGLQDGPRPQARFRTPTFLALDQGSGALFVSDSANRTIRRISPGSAGSVETLAGSGAAGATDGLARQAAFARPEGIALDDRGRLWIADSANHVIRRLDLSTGVVTTVAGMAGTAGFVDGGGSAARFREPLGLAVESESTASQLVRELRGDPPPPVSVVVADSGNQALRFVREDGHVTTLGVRSQGLTAPGKLHTLGRDVGRPLSVAVDAAGTIFVAGETGVRAILPGGESVNIAQAGTFRKPGALVAAPGRVLVADKETGLSDVRFGAPVVTRVNPGRIRGSGGMLTVNGRNFAPDSIVVVGALVVPAVVRNTEEIEVALPAVPGGRVTLSVTHRGGIAQAPILIEPKPLSELRPGEITTVAGGSTFSGDGGAATAALLTRPEQVAIDSRGNVFVADGGGHRVRRVDAGSGIITTVAGTGSFGFGGDGGPAVAAQLNAPAGVAVDVAGHVWIADTGNARIRRIHAATGIIETIAGGRPGFSGDGGPASLAQLNAPRSLSAGPDGSIAIADSTNHRIRLISRTGVIRTIAGNGRAESMGDGGPAASASLNSPRGVAFERGGSLLIAESFGHRIRRVRIDGVIETIAGTGAEGSAGDGGPAVSAGLSFPTGIAVDSAGGTWVADTGNHRVRWIDTRGVIDTVIGTGSAGFGGDRGGGRRAQVNSPSGVVVDAAGRVILADRGNHRIRELGPTAEVQTPFGVLGGGPAMRTLAGSGTALPSPAGVVAFATDLASPAGIALSPSGRLLIAEAGAHRVRWLDPLPGVLGTLAGSGTGGFAGDGGPASTAVFNSPQSVTVDADGNIYVADTNNHRVRRIDPSGVIATIAGTGVNAAGAEGVAGVESALSFPSGLSVDREGNVYISDTGNHRVRRWDRRTGSVTTVAGSGRAGLSGDGGAALQADLNSPRGISVDSRGSLWIADAANGRVRRVTPDGTIQTAVQGLDFPLDLASSGDSVFVADSFHHRVLAVRADASIEIVAGGGRAGFSGDGGPAVQANLFAPAGLTVDPRGFLWIADTVNQRVRAVRLR